MARIDRSRVYPKAVEWAFVENWPGFAEQSEADRAHLTIKVIQCYRQKRFQHIKYEDAICYHYQQRDADFGRGRFQLLNRHLNLFVVHEHWQRGEYTKGYALAEDAHALMENIPIRPQNRMVDDQGYVLRTPATWAIEERDSRGHSRKGTGNIPAVVQVDIDALLALQREGLEWKWHYKDGLPAPTTGRLGQRLAEMDGDQQRLNWLRFYLEIPVRLTLIQADTYHMPRGSAEVTYTEYESGRVYSATGFMQTACREIRAAAFRGCWDYDLSACHHALLAQYADRFGMETPAVSDYIRDKATIRRAIAQEIGVPLKAVKQAMTSLIYGSQRRATPIPGKKERPAILEAMGSTEKAEAFIHHPVVAALHGDITRVRDGIIKAMPTMRGYVINAMGKGIKPQKGKPAEVLSHILQGAEAACLHAVIRAHGDQLVMLMHDGWISRTRLDCEELTRTIQQGTEFVMECEETQLI